MNRGRRKETVFPDEETFLLFMSLLHETREMWKMRVSAYCLMPNHYHILVQTPEANLSRCMRHIDGVYTQRFHRRFGTDGQLFRGRYKAILVEEDAHLLQVLRYIHRNPLRAGLVSDLAQYSWSSHNGYISDSKMWGWLNRELLFSLLASDSTRQRRAYRQFMSKSEPAEISEFYAREKMFSILGSNPFMRWVKDTYFHLVQKEDISTYKTFAPTILEIVDAVCRSYKCSPTDLSMSLRGKENEPRNVAVYLARMLTGKRLADIGQHIGFAKSSAISGVLHRTRKRLKEDRRFARRVDEVEKGLKMSQVRT
jgi:REP element-mobilizing transposase RayT